MIDFKINLPRIQQIYVKCFFDFKTVLASS